MNKIGPIPYLDCTYIKTYSLFIFNSNVTGYYAFYLATPHAGVSDPLENTGVVIK